MSAHQVTHLRSRHWWCEHSWLSYGGVISCACLSFANCQRN